jgi:excisionase family DNA binding protein
MDERLLKGNEVAALLRISRSYAYQLMRQGEIPTLRFGRSVRVRERDLNAYINQCMTGKVGDFESPAIK